MLTAKDAGSLVAAAVRAAATSKSPRRTIAAVARGAVAAAAAALASSSASSTPAPTSFGKDERAPNASSAAAVALAERRRRRRLRVRERRQATHGASGDVPMEAGGTKRPRDVPAGAPLVARDGPVDALALAVRDPPGAPAVLPDAVLCVPNIPAPPAAPPGSGVMMEVDGARDLRHPVFVACSASGGRPDPGALQRAGPLPSGTLQLRPSKSNVGAVAPTAAARAAAWERDVQAVVDRAVAKAAAGAGMASSSASGGRRRAS